MNQSRTIGKVKLAMERLAFDMPLHAGLLSSWLVKENASVTQTMAIGFRSGRFVLWANPDFVSELTMAELGAVLTHEAGHVLFDHVYYEAKPSENRQARIIAEETAVNDWVVGPLPGNPILTSEFPMLSRNLSTDERYDILKGIVPDEPDVPHRADRPDGLGSYSGGWRGDLCSHRRGENAPAALGNKR